MSSPVGGFGICFDYGNQLTCEFDRTNGANRVVLRSNDALKLGVWYHVVFSFDGSSASLYLNGKLDKQAIFEEDTLIAPVYDTCVGVLGYGGHPTHWFASSVTVDE